MSLLPTLTLFAMMLALGMTLRGEDFRRVASARSAVLLGVLGQLVLLPAVAFAIAHLFVGPPTMAIGLVLVAACPGGVVSNVLSRLAHGDVALSISLTAVSSVVAFVTVPAVVGLGLRVFGGEHTQVTLGFAEMAMPLFLTTALPVLVGMATLRYRPALAARLHGPLLGISTGVLMLLILGLAVSIGRSAEELSLAALVRGAGAPVVALVAITMGLGMLGGRALGLDGATVRTLGLEVGLQNFNLALVVAMSLLGEQRYAGPALIYLPVMFAFAGGVVWLGRRAVAAQPVAAPGR